jgi:hypothetical protein
MSVRIFDLISFENISVISIPGILFYVVRHQSKLDGGLQQWL